MAFSSRPPTLENNTQGLENKCIVATKQHRDVHKDILHQPKNTNSSRDTGDNATHMVFEGKPVVNFTPRLSRLGLAQMEAPDKTKWGGLTALYLLNTKTLVLIGFSIMHP